MEYEWNPITDRTRKTLENAPMIGCMVWISYTDEYGNMDVMFARLETRDLREFNWCDAFSGDIIASIDDDCVTAWKYVDIPIPYES